MRKSTSLLLLFLLAPLLAEASAQWCIDADEFQAWVRDGDIVVTHDGALYNCCPDSIAFQVSREDDVILVQEEEFLTTPCDCQCCYNLGLTIGGAAPGEHSIRFRWFDYEDGAWAETWLSVTVPEGGRADGVSILDTYASDCLEMPQSTPDAGAPPDPPEETWGRIKLLFD